MNIRESVYLDGAANTPIDPDVLSAMMPYMDNTYVGNSKSIHDYGIASGQAVEQARVDMSCVLGCSSSEIYFTSGASEGNNWVIKSIAIRELTKKTGFRMTRIICGAMEHSSVLNCCKQVAEWGMDVQFVSPSNGRFLRPDDIEPLITRDTALICTMAVNNETGVENDIARITGVAYQHRIPILVDCTQALGNGGRYTAIGTIYPLATYMTFSAHKIYGPTGVGCLIMRDGYELPPLIVAGSQEKGLRGGTSNTAGVVGMASALTKIHSEDYKPLFHHLLVYLNELLLANLPQAKIVTWPTHENIVVVNFSDYFDYDQLASVLATEGIAVSAGSACDAEHDETAGDFNGSHVLVALGLSERGIRNTIRISFTKYTTERDIDTLIKTLKEMLEWQ